MAFKTSDATKPVVVLGALLGTVASWDRNEFGEQWALAVEAAYRKVEALLWEATEFVCPTEDAEDDAS